VKRSHAFLRHILTSKDKKRKKQLRGATLVSEADAPKVKRMIPY
jgi:large subunit ribosomal protein L35